MDLEPTGTTGRDETKEKRAMANMRMMTATALAALLAMGAAPAAMADTDATIELDAASGGALDGHTYTAYRIGTYGNVEKTGGKVTRVDVTNDAKSKTWLAAALKSADVDRAKGCDEAGTIAHLTDATKTRRPPPCPSPKACIWSSIPTASPSSSERRSEVSTWHPRRWAWRT